MYYFETDGVVFYLNNSYLINYTLNRDVLINYTNLLISVKIIKMTLILKRIEYLLLSL